MQVSSALLALLLVSGCGGSKAPASSTSNVVDPGKKEAGAPDTTVFEMHQHFENITALKDAIISGDLVETKKAARKTAYGFEGDAPEGWQPFVERVVAHALEVETTKSMGEIATHVSAMARTCGECHNGKSIQPVQYDGTLPSHSGDKFDDFMLRHRWAADRMWEGLIGPSESAWLAGAKILSEATLAIEDVETRIAVTGEIETILEQLQTTIAMAGAAQGSKARQDLYANFLTGCAGCHQAMQNLKP